MTLGNYNHPSRLELLHTRYSPIRFDMLQWIEPILEDIVSETSKPFGSTQGKPAPATPLNPRRRGIIVGASAGLGAELARKLAKEVYSLALLARGKDRLDALCREINSAGGETRAYAHNVTDYDKVPALLRNIVSDLGGLDLVIFVASVNHPPGGMEKYIFEQDREMVETNLIGAMAWMTPIAEMFQSAGAGQIVGISSVAGDRGRVGNPGYNTSKAGLTTYLEALRNRLTRRGVHVLTVKPGFMKTEMLKATSGPTPFAIEPSKAADHIIRAMKKRKQVIYTALMVIFTSFLTGVLTALLIFALLGRYFDKPAPVGSPSASPVGGHA